ncbi:MULTISPECIES: hypothetical protein [Microbacterium]|jgi:hypothetical protein|uniref:hypothetical protein n=1 Tax=Microbacterium TaxID=33882 RepID=UPI0023DA43EA|nr:MULTISPECIES: hypothetical protein [Microbacterium]MDF2045429.1 hypothetical protein [Microbacterium sp. Kw_RZR3]MDF2917514.1 hypothetical protein [Microbacterium sp.]MDQ1074631.1 hypothetical protein [Microbacterium sp. SORGH_AS_0969]MDQ1114857.1 hypothetical protein [Microbacterium testaceum]
MNDDVDNALHAIMTRADRARDVSDDGVRVRASTMARAIVADDRNRGRRKRVLAAALVPVFVLGTAGAAYAAVAVDWSRFWMEPAAWETWALSPDASFAYTLPGGGTCEVRIGDVTFSPAADRPADVPADPAAADAAREYLRTTDLAHAIDVDAEIAKLRQEPMTYEGEGESVPFGFGTNQYNADVEYNIAVKDAVFTAVMSHVEAVGYPTTGLGFSSQELCEGEKR